MDDNRRFSKIDLEERRRELIEIINRRARRAGCEMPADVKTFIIDIEDMIIEQFPYVTLAEVSKALENGFSGKYSKPMKSGLYPDKIISYIRAYREEMGYYNKVNNHSVVEELPPSLVTAQDIKNYVVYYFAAYIDWRNGGNEPYLKAKLAYDALYYMGIFKYDTPPQEFLVKAESVETSSRFEQHIRGLINLNFAAKISLQSEGIINIAKKLYLYNYFESLIMQDITIQSEIEMAQVPQKYVNIRNYELTH